MSLGGTDQNVIEIMSEIESMIIHKFYYANKILIRLAIFFTLLIVVFPSIFRNPYISIGTSLVIIWGILIHVFHEKTKQILTKLVLS